MQGKAGEVSSLANIKYDLTRYDMPDHLVTYLPDIWEIHLDVSRMSVEISEILAISRTVTSMPVH